MTDPKAGRELDMLIAEKVFGWEWVVIDGDASGERLLVQSGKIDRYDFYRRATGNEPIAAGSWRLSIPFYRTQIADAWLVVEKLIALGWDIRLEHIETAQGMQWRAALDERVGFGVEDEFASHLPLAVCLAALRAVEHAQSGVTNCRETVRHE